MIAFICNMLYVLPLKYRFFQNVHHSDGNSFVKNRNLRRQSHLSAQNKLIKESITSIMHARDERAGADGLRFFRWTSTSLPCSWNRRTASARLPSAFSTPSAGSVPASRTWTPRQSWTRPPPRSVTTIEQILLLQVIRFISYYNKLVISILGSNSVGTNILYCFYDTYHCGHKWRLDFAHEQLLPVDVSEKRLLFHILGVALGRAQAPVWVLP